MSTRFLLHGVAVAFLALMGASANDASAVTIAWSPVGNAGNTADPATGFGAVGYDYQIGTYDVTNAQYAEFLNAKDPTGVDGLKLYDSFVRSFDHNNNGVTFTASNPAGAKYGVVSGLGSRPVIDISWFSAVRFANWINNGQGNADTESGAYTLLGNTPIPSNGGIITRNSTAHIALPSENEWYKGAYFDLASHSYFQYPTSSNTAPSAVVPPGGTNSANYFGIAGGSTDVGAYALSLSPYHTYDQGGNVNQWIEAVGDNGASRFYRGGSYGENVDRLASASRHNFGPGGSASFIGFRLAMVPEPSSGLLAMAAGIGLLWYKVTRRHVGNGSRFRRSPRASR